VTKQTIDRENSQPFDFHCWSNESKANTLVDKLWFEHFEHKFPQTGRGKKPETPYRIQFKVVLLNLYNAWLRDPEMSIGVAKSKTAYGLNERYNPRHISSAIIKLINHLEETGFIDKRTGSEVSQTRTRIRANKKLTSLFKVYRLSFFDLTQEYGIEETIILSKHETEQDTKTKKSLRIDYVDTDFEPIVRMRESVREYNALLWRTFIDIPTLDIPFVPQPYWSKKDKKYKERKVWLTQNNKFVKRIFYRGDWNLGGRFHGGWWQSIKEHWRKQIYINNESTIEQDYSGLHINLLYGLEQIQPPSGDHYEVDHILSNVTPEQQRKAVKGLSLMAINAENTSKALSAFRQKEDYDSPFKNLTHKKLQMLLDAFKEKHPRIADKLCSDAGVKLMNIDSKITARVIDHFTKKNVPILTIHDSYITPQNYSGELNKVMNESVAEELNGMIIKIDQEGIGTDQIQAFKNMDRSNSLDYKYDNVPSYTLSGGYKERLKRHTEWLNTLNIN
jgi:hypothetical protein